MKGLVKRRRIIVTPPRSGKAPAIRADAAPSRMPRSAGPIRLLPITLVAVAVMLGLRVSEVYEAFNGLTDGWRVYTAEATAQSVTIRQAPAAEGGVDAARGTPVEPTAFSQEELAALQALRERRDQIQRREDAVKKEESRLREAADRLDEKAQELEAMKLSLQTMLSRTSQVEDERLRNLVAIYDAMKPKEAAQIFDKLQDDVLLSVVQRMKPNKISPILAAMNADRAQKLTAMLAAAEQRPSAAAPAAQPAR
jgi:flagellar motility protein MotE (MotC chaperone)